MTQFPQYQDYVAGGGSAAYTNPTVGTPTAAPSSTPTRTRSQPTAPSLGLHVTNAERDRAESFLAEAYADGRLSEWDFDQRLEQVLTATTRRDLNSAFYGLVEVPSTSRALGLHPAYHPSLVNNQADGRFGQTAAGLAHFSAFFGWIFGPLVFRLLSSPGSYARRESAKAFNFQLLSGTAFMGIGIVAGLFNTAGWLLAMLWLAWVVLTIVGGVKAFQGDDWHNPATRFSHWHPMDEGPKKGGSQFGGGR